MMQPSDGCIISAADGGGAGNGQGIELAGAPPLCTGVAYGLSQARRRTIELVAREAGAPLFSLVRLSLALVSARGSCGARLPSPSQESRLANNKTYKCKFALARSPVLSAHFSLPLLATFLSMASLWQVFWGQQELAPSSRTLESTRACVLGGRPTVARPDEPHSCAGGPAPRSASLNFLSLPPGTGHTTATFEPEGSLTGWPEEGPGPAASVAQNRGHWGGGFRPLDLHH